MRWDMPSNIHKHQRPMPPNPRHPPPNLPRKSLNINNGVRQPIPNGAPVHSNHIPRFRVPEPSDREPDAQDVSQGRILFLYSVVGWGWGAAAGAV